MKTIPRLMLVTDRLRTLVPLPELARRAVDGGVDLVQIREKELGIHELFNVVRDVIEAIGDRSKVSVNSQVLIAQRLGIDVHLPETGTSAAAARRLLGPEALIGRSVHSRQAALESDGADYLIAGHVFAMSGKQEIKPLGLEGLRDIVHASPMPVLAIGGIDETNAATVMEQGAFGVAVVSAIGAAEDPAAAASRLRRVIDDYLEPKMESGSNGIVATINGKQVNLRGDITIRQFLEDKGYHERLVVVEVNEKIVPRSAFDATSFHNGDRVEIVHFVGGG